MSDTLKTFRLSDMREIVQEEMRRRIREQKAEYQAKLDALGATAAIKDAARVLARRKDSCRRCVFCCGDSPLCFAPYSDLTMETLDIDPCYEGVLRYLIKP